jgi:hypothetical protein
MLLGRDSARHPVAAAQAETPRQLAILNKALHDAKGAPYGQIRPGTMNVLDRDTG